MEEYDGYEGSGLDLYHLSDILDSLGEDYITLWPLKRIMIVKRTTGAKENNFRASNLTIYNNIFPIYNNIWKQAGAELCLAEGSSWFFRSSFFDLI